MCPAAYRSLFGYTREQQLGVRFVNFETHSWGREALEGGNTSESATGQQLLAEIARREEAHLRQAKGPHTSRVLKRARPCTPW